VIGNDDTGKEKVQRSGGRS